MLFARDGLGAICGEGLERISATLGEPSLGGLASLGSVDANLDPVVLSVTDKGLNPNGPAPDGGGGSRFAGRVWSSTFFWTATGGGGGGGGPPDDNSRQLVHWRD